MAQGNPLPGERYLHFKDKLYQIVAVAYHSETMEKYVVYQALYGDFRVFIRPFDMFVSEVDHEKYPEVRQKYRFQYVEEMSARGKERNRSEAEQEPVKPTEVENREETETEKINPWLLKFLDAENFDEKYKIVCDMHRDVDDRLIDDIAVVMDVVIPEGKLSERYAQLKYCIRTRQHYEQSRFR